MTRNIEIKVRIPAGHDVEALLESEPDLRDAGVLRQHDIFFDSSRGRLKLRLEEGGGAQLIHYEREDAPVLRRSDYRIVEVEEGDPLLALLDAALGRIGEVRKQRRLFQRHNVRIHVDDVEELGRFLELEAVVDATHPEEECVAAASDLLRRLGLHAVEPERLSYLDLIAEQKS
jgi:predicted adenylyl cyclase CyaB